MDKGALLLFLLFSVIIVIISVYFRIDKKINKVYAMCLNIIIIIKIIIIILMILCYFQIVYIKYSFFLELVLPIFIIDGVTLWFRRFQITEKNE